MMIDRVGFVREIIQKGSTFVPKHFSSPKKIFDATTTNPRYENIGIDLLRKNKVATLMVAGGISTRLGVKGLRGDIPIGPVTNRSIFRLQGEKIAAIRERYAPNMLWLVMTSEEVHEATLASFRREDYFGVPSESILFFQQSSFPVLDADANPVILSNGKYMGSPGGHGGFLDAAKKSGLIPRLLREGVEYIYYFQYPNVLENICDPVMLGYHHVEQFDMTVKSTMDYRPDEPVGRCVEVNGRLCIVEYHFIKDVIDQALWNYFPANLGTYIVSVSLLVNCLKNDVVLPYHIVRNHDQGVRILSKIEQFAFDLLFHSSRSGLMVVAREDEYALIKTKDGLYSIEAGKFALARLYFSWLIRAGAVPQEQVERYTVEISPKFALNFKELQSKIHPGFQVSNNMTLK